MWGFILELKQSVRSKKFIATLGIMLLLYVPFFYMMKRYGNVSAMEVKDIIGNMIQFLSGMAMFFIAILALLMGTTAINSEIEKGTLRIALSKPISRLNYIIGKMLAQALVIFIALMLSTGTAVIGFVAIGVPLTGLLVREVFLLNMVLFLGLVQLLFLGYLFSTFIKSSTTALGIALVLFFVVSMIAPAIVTFMALSHSTPDNYEEVYSDYATKYLFFDPNAQVGIVLNNVNERKCYEYVQTYNKETGTVTRKTKEVPTCNNYISRTNVNETSGTIESMGCICNETYAGIAHSIRKNSVNLGILIGMTIIYGLLAVGRFLRMDLR
ncbi:ABC transporter permease [Thermococcus sp. AM4]|uniref:ABC transporter permease n=1 Tax=Thermococcus sp. (strain AM4) TaxID=246969 RepID=UPI0001870A38|nr:ABC transporter permease subunit [Thermococcus sp. AM4]EEB74450.1 ABC-type transport system, permease component [Thermococcus sp. AM4]